jgi:hypothetical protein
MLPQDISAQLLEINFMPDCARACVYYEDFADTLFEAMFIDEKQWGPTGAKEQYHRL